MKPHSSLWHGGKYSKHPNHMGRHRESQKILQHIPLGSDCFFLQTPRFPERLCLGGPRSTASVSRSWRGSEVGSPERTALGNARAPERTPWPRVPGLSIGDNNEAPFVLICGLNRQVLEIRIIPPCRPYWGGVMEKCAAGGRSREQNTTTASQRRLVAEAKVTTAWAQVSGGI